MRENNDKKQMKKSTKVILIILSVFLALVVVAMAALMIWGKSLLSLIPRLGTDDATLSQEEADNIRNETDPYDPDFTGPSHNSNDLDKPDQAEDVENSDDIIQVLLVGQDRREGQSRQRSDAMILCTINKKTKTLTMTSFLRDLWVHIPGYYDERLNVPYAIGGFPLLNKTMQYQFGIHADYNVEVDFSGFEGVVDVLGGVDIKLTSGEAYTLNKKTSWGLTEGVNRLSGEQALAYARIRNIDSDFNRTNRQRTVLNSVIEQMRGKSATELYNIALKILPMVTTDMKDSEILALILEVAPILSDLKVESQRIPLDNTYTLAYIDSKSVILLKPDGLKKNRDFIKHTLGK